MSQEYGVEIAAAGHGSRLREAMRDAGYAESFPKHLLPTGAPDDETLLGRIIRQGLAAPVSGNIEVSTNPRNHDVIVGHPDIDERAVFDCAEPDNPFGPFIRPLVEERRRTLGCAGDFYAEFDWASVLDHHDSHKWPVTFVAGQTVVVDEGATYDISDAGQITRFYRPERTNASDVINIGIYIFDPAQSVIKALEEIGIDKSSVRPLNVSSETIVNTLIHKGLIGAYVLPPNTGFNINTPETYQALLSHTAQRKVA